ncbi:helicase C-terminal domain-containing protein, partial [Brevibacterium sp. ZH18]|uniref:helicase C-terminal domain-containing protein n=1 Tax=Brevibacterium sp. ZH18 TaxID=2927784 RepID=UPI001F615FD5
LLISEDSVSLLCSHVSTVPVLEWSIKETRPSSTASLAEHIQEALNLSEEHQAETVQIDSATAQLAAFSPGNVALRSIRSLAHGSPIADKVIWQTAFRLSEGLRSLFNRPESVALLTELYTDNSPYWRKVLNYCADGNLRSVLDEYLFQLHSETGSKELDGKTLENMVETAVGALTFKTANYTARTADGERQKIRFSSGFAVRYGSAQSSEGESSTARMSEVRGAFNSPFAPFVLASTSVGQEGIDFHWWSHSVVHWNVPSNPVDFEQREGRVNRFGGHAVRKNIAQKHWADILEGNDPFAWRDASSAAEAEAEAAELGDFYPWWMYPGDARINRIIAKYPLSKDVARYERLKDALVSYRLALGQPRQEDMLELLDKRGIDGSTIPPIDLRAPKRQTE